MNTYYFYENHQISVEAFKRRSDRKIKKFASAHDLSYRKIQEKIGSEIINARLGQAQHRIKLYLKTQERQDFLYEYLSIGDELEAITQKLQLPERTRLVNEEILSLCQDLNHLYSDYADNILYKSLCDYNQIKNLCDTEALLELILARLLNRSRFSIKHLPNLLSEQIIILRLSRAPDNNAMFLLKNAK